MKATFCTITTFSHLHKVLALHTSIQRYDTGMELHVLVIDEVKAVKTKLPETIRLYSLKDIEQLPYVREMLMKYEDADRRRWVLKPVFMAYLLTKTEKLIYLDNDIYFFNDYHFLFDDLDNNRMLLTPHWRCSNPFISEDYFIVNYTDGIFNAGFAGANKNSVEILDWWALACNYKCEKNKEKGLWDDQKYLDLIPARFEGIGIVRHKGCNVAVWNKHDNKRSKANDTVTINDTLPIVFIHFTNDTIADIKENKHGGDPLLLPHVLEYERTLNDSTNLLNPA